MNQLLINFCLFVSFVNNSFIHSLILSILRGLKNIAQLGHAISGKEEILEQARGIPCHIASKTGNQNHS